VVGIDLGGRCEVVTGASSGIGAETATVLGACGARVIATGRDPVRLERTVAAIRAQGGEAHSVVADLAEPTAVDAISNYVSEVTDRVDILALAAGHFEHKPFTDTTAAELDLLWAVHVRAPFLLAQALLSRMSARSSVLFYSSTVAHLGFAPYAGYSAVKGAVEALARSLAVELAPDIRVNIIAPGFTATPMVTAQYDAVGELEAALVSRTPVGFVDGPSSVAHLAAYLCSDLGRYVDGARLVVDGGWSAQGWQTG
jgi:NAD(P)-dependent dehydrogenase (short-subunit alcohol dehydrogenase family)